MKILKCDRCLKELGVEMNDKPIIKARGLISYQRPGYPLEPHKIGERHVCQPCYDLYFEMLDGFWGTSSDE